MEGSWARRGLRKIADIGGSVALASAAAVVVAAWVASGPISATVARGLLWPALFACALVGVWRGGRVRIGAVGGGAVGVGAVARAWVAMAWPDQGAGGAEVSVLTYNVLFRGSDPSASLDAIAAHPADLVLVQELTPAFARRLRARRIGPRASLHPLAGTAGLGVISRTKVRREVLLRNDRGTPFAQCFETTIAGADVAVCNVHLLSPAAVLRRPATFRRDFARNARTRAEQWRQIVAHLASRRVALTVVAGDLNTLEYEPLHAAFTRAHVDAFRARKAGIGGTFPNPTVRLAAWIGSAWAGRLAPIAGWLPRAVRIDYVLASPQMAVRGAEVIGGGGSDHHAVRAQLQLP